MRAEMTVTHRTGDFLGLLMASLPADDRSCLSRSLLFGDSPVWWANVSFATETPQWRVIVYTDGVDQWQMIVEAIRGDLKLACESLWRSISKAVADLRPRLSSLAIVDDGTDQILVRASTGVIPEFMRKEFWLPLALGPVNAIVLLVAGSSFATVRGAIPGFAAAAIALSLLITDTVRKKLVWHD